VSVIRRAMDLADMTLARTLRLPTASRDEGLYDVAGNVDDEAGNVDDVVGNVSDVTGSLDDVAGNMRLSLPGGSRYPARDTLDAARSFLRLGRRREQRLRGRKR
jgi:hypothetical protein